MELKTAGERTVSRVRGLVDAIRVELSGAGPSPTIGDLASRPLASVSPKATLAAVVDELVGEDIGVVGVVEDGAVLGLVSERDIVDAMAGGADLDTIWAADVMSTELNWIGPDQDAAEAAARMRDIGVRHLLVRTGGRDAAAVVSMRDLIPCLLDLDRRARS